MRLGSSEATTFRGSARFCLWSELRNTSTDGRRELHDFLLLPAEFVYFPTSTRSLGRLRDALPPAQCSTSIKRHQKGGNPPSHFVDLSAR